LAVAVKRFTALLQNFQIFQRLQSAAANVVLVGYLAKKASFPAGWENPGFGEAGNIGSPWLCLPAHVYYILFS
jgi:hypothetical protein